MELLGAKPTRIDTSEQPPKKQGPPWLGGGKMTKPDSNF